MKFTRVTYGIRRSAATDVYFLNVKVGGKLIRDSLETTDLDIAKDRRDERIKKEKKAAAQGNDNKGVMTLAEGLKAYQEDLDHRLKMGQRSPRGVSEATHESYSGCLAHIRSLFPPAALERRLRDLKSSDMQKWLEPLQLAQGATNYNTCRTILVAVFKAGVEACACLENVARSLEFRKGNKKNIKLLTPEQWVSLVANIRANCSVESMARRDVVRNMLAGYGDDYVKALNDRPEWKEALGLADVMASDRAQWRVLWDLVYYIKTLEPDVTRRAMESADLVEFLTYTGARIDETRTRSLDDVDLNKMLVSFPPESVKGETREKVVPIHPALVPVLERCRKRAALRGDNRLFGIQGCNKAIRNACKRLGLPHQSHHSFRHLFGTIALESGMSQETVADLMGHSDGGRTLMEKYAHVRAQKAAPQVAKLQFGLSTRDAEIAALKARLAVLEAEQPENVVELKQVGF